MSFRDFCLYLLACLVAVIVFVHGLNALEQPLRQRHKIFCVNCR